MLKWLLVIVVVACAGGFAEAALRRRFPRGLPGDLRWRIGGRELRIGLGMTVLLSLLATLMLRRL